MSRLPLVGLAAIAALANAAQIADATLVLDGGSHTLLPNTAGQAVPIFVSTNASDMVTGINVLAVLGDGFGAAAEPVFSGVPGTLQGVDFTGGIWDAFASTPSGAAPVVGAAQYATPTVLFNLAGDQVVAGGLAAILFVDTTGFTSGTYPLVLDGSVSPIGSTDFLGPSGVTITPSVINGSITVVPEPSAFLYGGIISVLAACCVHIQRRLKGKSADATSSNCCVPPLLGPQAAALPGVVNRQSSVPVGVFRGRGQSRTGNSFLRSW